MLPAVHRLRSPHDFTATTRQGVSAASPSVVGYLRVAPDGTAVDLPPRVGLIVSRAVGGSVERHRVARRLRAAVRPLLPRLPAGSTLVLRALPAAARDRHLNRSAADAIERVLRRA